MRIVDGPDEVHLLQVGRREVKAKTHAEAPAQTQAKAQAAGISGHDGRSGRQSARLMGAEKDGSASLSSSSSSAAHDAKIGTNDDIYDVKIKIEAQRRKSAELAEKYRSSTNSNYNNNVIDLSRDELDVEAFKNKEMEMKRKRKLVDGARRAKL